MRFITAVIGAGHSDNPRTYIIVPRVRAYLRDLLAKAFEGRGVEVIVDRRSQERRTHQAPVKVERRSGERRRPKEKMIEVVIEGLPPNREANEGPA